MTYYFKALALVIRGARYHRFAGTSLQFRVYANCA